MLIDTRQNLTFSTLPCANGKEQSSIERCTLFKYSGEAIGNSHGLVRLSIQPKDFIFHSVMKALKDSLVGNTVFHTADTYHPGKFESHAGFFSCAYQTKNLSQSPLDKILHSIDTLGPGQRRPENKHPQNGVRSSFTMRPRAFHHRNPGQARYIDTHAPRSGKSPI